MSSNAVLLYKGDYNMTDINLLLSPERLRDLETYCASFYDQQVSLSAVSERASLYDMCLVDKYADYIEFYPFSDINTIFYYNRHTQQLQLSKFKCKFLQEFDENVGIEVLEEYCYAFTVINDVSLTTFCKYFDAHPEVEVLYISPECITFKFDTGDINPDGDHVFDRFYYNAITCKIVEERT